MAGKLDKVDSKLGGMDEKLSGMDEKLGNIDENLKMFPKRIAEAIRENKKVVLRTSQRKFTSLLAKGSLRGEEGRFRGSSVRVG